MNIKEFDISCWIKDNFNKIGSSDKIAFLFAVFVGLCAHGAALVDFFINEDDFIGGWVGFYSSGRFFADIIYGCIENLPVLFLQSLLFIILVAASGVFVANILGVKSTFIKSLISSVVISFPAFSVGVTYTMMPLVYAVAMFFSVFSVYFAKKDGWGNFIIASVLLMLSLGSYQAYLSVSATLCASILLLLVLKIDVVSKGSVYGFLKKAVRFFLYGIASGILYLIAVKVSTIYYGTALGANQGADKMGSVDISFAALHKIYDAYLAFWNNHYFNMPAFFNNVLIVIALFVSIALLCNVLRKGEIKDKVLRLILILVFLLIVFVAGFAVTFVAPYSEINILQSYGIMVILCLALSIVADSSKLFKNFAIVLSLIIIVFFVNRNNAQYYKASLVTKASLDTVSRIFARVEKTKGFNAESKIALVGVLPNKVLRSITTMPFNEINSGYSGNFVGLSRPNQSHKFSTLMAYLGYDVKYADKPNELLRAHKRALSMPTYPAEGSVVADGNLIVVKLNEPRLLLKTEVLGNKKYHFEYTPFTDSKNLKYSWVVVSVTQKTGKIITSSAPQLDIQFERSGETCYVIGEYRDFGSNKVMKSVPYWFIVN